MMRRIFFTIAILLFSWNVFSQGIQFEIGSWKEVLQKAKQENKLIFVDLYTTWCGPCKKMAAETFPQQAVGDYFNKNFVNYKIDAEKGEGPELAGKYEVSAYPTLVFVNAAGELVYKFMGVVRPINLSLKERKPCVCMRWLPVLQRWRKNTNKENGEKYSWESITLY